MVALVIGPSGVGKSDYGSHAAIEVPGCSFFDLDTLVSQRVNMPASKLLPQIGNDAFFDHCRFQVDCLLQSGVQGIAIVAVGAGALQSGKAYDWLVQYAGPTIAVIAPPDEVYRRGGKRNCNRNLEQFIATEYSDTRRRLYGVAKHMCDVDRLSLEAARAIFTATIRRLGQ